MFTGGLVTIETYVKKTYMDKFVDVYCGGKDWFYGVVADCVDGVLTLSAPEGKVHLNTERILSVSPRKH